MSDEKWVTLTPEQVEALEQGVIVRAHRGDTMVQGPLTSLVGEFGPDVWVGEIRVKSPERIEVRERDVPKPDLDAPALRPGDRVSVTIGGREFVGTIRTAASRYSALGGSVADAQPAGVSEEGSGVREAASEAPGEPVTDPTTLKAGDRVSYLMRGRPYAGRLLRDGRGPLFIDADNAYSLASHGRWLDGVSDVRLIAREPDPQRLVSVRADDLESIVEDWVNEAGYAPGEFPHIDRIRAALRGETS